jgi:hypothetical protein
MATKMSEYYLTQLVRKLDGKNRIILGLSVRWPSEEHVFQQPQTFISPS